MNKKILQLGLNPTCLGLLRSRAILIGINIYDHDHFLLLFHWHSVSLKCPM